MRYDYDKSSALDINEFGVLLKSIIPGVRKFEIDELFKKFDTDGDQTGIFDKIINFFFSFL